MMNSIILFSFCVVVLFTFTNADENLMFNLNFDAKNVDNLEMGSSTNMIFYAHSNATWDDEDFKIQVISSDVNVAYTDRQLFPLPQKSNEPNIWLFSFNLTTEFLGYTKLSLQVVEMSELIT